MELQQFDIINVKQSVVIENVLKVQLLKELDFLTHKKGQLEVNNFFLYERLHTEQESVGGMCR